MRKIFISLILCGILLGCGKVVEDGEHNKITTIMLRENTYIYTINGVGNMEDSHINWISEKDLELKVGDLVTITKFEEVEVK